MRAGFERSGVPVWGELGARFQLPQSRLSESDRFDVRLCDSGPEACERVPGYVVLDVRAGLQLDAALRLNVAFENVLDAGYKTYASGAYAPGRNFTIAIRGSM